MKINNCAYTNMFDVDCYRKEIYRVILGEDWESAGVLLWLFHDDSFLIKFCEIVVN
jgi:hypothetical protein